MLFGDVVWLCGFLFVGGVMDTLNILYLVSAVLIFISIMTTTLSARLGVPLLLFFLGVGILAGEEGILGIEFSQYNLANFIGQAALACILLDGGLRTSLQSFRVGLKPAVVLASWGVFATVLLLGGFVTWLLEVDWRLGMLIAAIVGSTDAAAVFSLLRNGGIRLNERVQATLEIESGANDPLAILLVTVLIAINLDPASQTVASIAKLLIGQIGIGLIFGLASGFVLSRLLPKVHLAEGMYAILIMSAGFMVFSSANLLGGSGFLAVYLAGVAIGNTKVRATEHVLRVMDSFAWLSQAVLFVVLGLLVLPSSLLDIWYHSLLVFLFLLLIARPLAVMTSLLPFGFNGREIGFISWVGLRGAVPITLAIIPVMMAVPNAHLIFNMAFGLVILSLLTQGTTIAMVARLFQVWVPTNDEPKERHEIWVGDHASITLYEFQVSQRAFAVGRHPVHISTKFNTKEVHLFAVVRNQMLLAITDETTLRAGDVVWYALSGDYASSIAKIFNNSTTQYQKSSEFYGDWLLSPQAKIADLPFFNRPSALVQMQNQVQNKLQVTNKSLALLQIFTPKVDKPLADVDEHLLANLNEHQNKTIEQYMLMHLNTKPVRGDKVALNDAWVLIVRDMDRHGKILGVGLKNIADSQTKLK